MGLLEDFRCCSLGLQIRQELLQPQIGPLRQPRTEQHQRQGEIPHLRAEPIGGLFLSLEAVGAALPRLQGQELQGGLPFQQRELHGLGIGGCNFPLGDQPAESGRQSLKELAFRLIAPLITPLVVEDQEHRFRWVGTCWPLAPTQGQQVSGALVLREGQIREDSPEESHDLQRHGVQPLASIKAHDAAPVESKGVVGVLDRQLALANPAHAREIGPAAFWGQEALELLQFLAAAHEPLGAGGEFWEVVGGVRGKDGP